MLIKTFHLKIILLIILWQTLELIKHRSLNPINLSDFVDLKSKVKLVLFKQNKSRNEFIIPIIYCTGNTNIKYIL